MSSTEIRNALIITQDRDRKVLKGNIYIEENLIKSVSTQQQEADNVVDASGKIVAPGFINTHCHVAMSHLRGKLDDMPLGKFLDRTFKLDTERTDEGIYNSALLGMHEMMESGVTSFLDLYYAEDRIAEAAKKSGIRAFLAWVTLDEDKTTQKGNPTKNAVEFISKYKGQDMISPSIGVQGVYVASDEVYLKAKEVAEKQDTIVHGHLAETREEVYNFMKGNKGVRPTEHLDSIGFLGPRFVAAHGVWNTLREVTLLGKNGCSVSWNPVSNAKLGVGGLAPVPEYLANGVTVGIGSDSSGSNNNQELLQSMKFGSIWVKNERWDPSITTAQSILDMATVNGAKALKRDDIGSIEAGKKADLVFFNTRSPRLMLTTPETAISNIVYSADTSAVSDVMINGRFVKKDSSLVDYDPSFFEEKPFI